MLKSIPERWLAYEPHGAVIDGTNILPFKVPLKEAIAKRLPPPERFTPDRLIKEFPKLKFIVDVTNTFRYYDLKDLQDAGIRHHKIMVPGHIVPPDVSFMRFCAVMDLFRSQAKNGELIGVHCTHGVNRTGYLICRYLVQQLGWEPQDSVKAFEKARGYPIERSAYVTAVMSAPRTKLDLSNVCVNSVFEMEQRAKKHGRGPRPIGTTLRSARFANSRPYPPQPPPFAFGGPLAPPRGIGPRPPIIPPIPPRPPRRWLDGRRPHGHDMLPIRPPGSGPFLGPRFPPRMPGPPDMPGPPRLPLPNFGPPSRLPGPGMPPPRLPPPGMGPPLLPPPGSVPPRMPPPLSYAAVCRGSAALSDRRRSVRCEDRSHGPYGRNKSEAAALLETGRGPSAPGVSNNLDFTVDTFEENLATTVRPRGELEPRSSGSMAKGSPQ